MSRVLSPHKRAPRALLEYLQAGRLPVKGEDYIENPWEGRSRNLDKEYKNCAYAAGDRKGRMIEMAEDFVEDELYVTGLCATEFGSPTYDTTHVVDAQFMQSRVDLPVYLRGQYRKWLDQWFSVCTLTSSPNRRSRSVLGEVRQDRLRSGVHVNPPCQRAIFHKGQPTRPVIWRTDVSWAYMIMSGKPYKVRRPKVTPNTSGSEIDCLCLEEMARQGCLYYPTASREAIESVRLAMPFDYSWFQDGSWLAEAIKPYRVNPNNRRVEETGGECGRWRGEWLDVLGHFEIGGPWSPQPTTTDPPADPPPKVKEISERALRRLIEDLKRGDVRTALARAERWAS